MTLIVIISRSESHHVWNHRCTAVFLSEACKTLSEVGLSRPRSLRPAGFALAASANQRACALNLCRLYCQRNCLEENPHVSRVIGTRIYSDVSPFSVGRHGIFVTIKKNVSFAVSFSLICRSRAYAERRSTLGWFGMRRAATLTWCQWTWRNITPPRIKMAFSQRGRETSAQASWPKLGTVVPPVVFAGLIFNQHPVLQLENEVFNALEQSVDGWEINVSQVERYLFPPPSHVDLIFDRYHLVRLSALESD